MKEDAARDFLCDLCGESDAIEVPHAQAYTAGQPIHICRGCGFVYVRRRRSAEKIAAVWSDELFGTAYTAALPGMVARLAYVAAFSDQVVGLRGAAVCEIGAGEGRFLDLVRRHPYEAEVFAVEPSPANCQLMRSLDIDSFCGTIEQFCAEKPPQEESFDLVAILWTLENCESCLAMLAGARSLLRDGGVVVVATGSRILVPFKKPLHAYLNSYPADIHPFRFSANTLRKALTRSGFRPAAINRYMDNDVLCVVGEKTDAGPEDWEGDDPLAVYAFFDRWHGDTQLYFPERLAGGPGGGETPQAKAASFADDRG